MPAYAKMSTDSSAIIQDVISYGRIVCLFSFGLFLESIWTKVLQANGDMKTPMIAQICGAIINIILDPILIFGMFGMPKLGISGAAIATVIGQLTAALIVMKKGFRRPPSKERYIPNIKLIFNRGIPNSSQVQTLKKYIQEEQIISPCVLVYISFHRTDHKRCRLDFLREVSGKTLFEKY